MIIELDLHPHRSQRLDEMRLIGQHEAETTGFKDDLGGRLKHLVAQPTFEHSDDAPHARLGAMFPAQACGQRTLIEHRSPLVGIRRRRPELTGSLNKIDHEPRRMDFSADVG